MKTFTVIAVAGLVLAMLPATVMAATAKKPAAHTKVAAATKYECVKCHMVYSAADAKAAKYKCEMDGGKLVPVKTASAKKPAAAMHKM